MPVAILHRPWRSPCCCSWSRSGARLLTAAVFGDPAYPDSFYYVNVARQLAGRPRLQRRLHLELRGGRRPAARRRRPSCRSPRTPTGCRSRRSSRCRSSGCSGPTALASGLPFWLVRRGRGAAHLVDRPRRRAAALAGHRAAACWSPFPGAVAPYLAQPDNFALFMLLGALALWACARGLRGDRRAFVLGGLLRRPRHPVAQRRHPAGRPVRARLRSPTCCAQAASHARHRLASPPAVCLRAGFLLLVVALVPAPAERLRVALAVGGQRPHPVDHRLPPALQRQRGDDARDLPGPGHRSAAGEPARRPGLGARHLRGDAAAGLPGAVHADRRVAVGAATPSFIPWLVYAVTLFAFSALLFAVHVPYGTFLHSAVALLPHAYLRRCWASPRPCAGSPAGGRLGRADAPRASSPRWPSAWCCWAGVVGSCVTLRAVALRARPARAGTGRRWRQRRPTDRLMSPDAGAYRYLAAAPGIVTPDDPLPVVEEALREYGIRWLVLERDHITPALAPLLAGTERPSWLSAPVLSVPGTLRGGADPARGTAERAAAARRALRRLPRARTTRGARRDAGAMPRLAPARRCCAAGPRLVALPSAAAHGHASPPPRAAPTTSAWRATWSAATALVSDAVWSYATPPLVAAEAGVRAVAADGDLRRGAADGPLRHARSPRPRRAAWSSARSSRR